MIIQSRSCVRGALSLLVEVREALSDEANTVLIEKLDESIRQLTEIESTEQIDTRAVIEVLRTIGDLLGLIPVVVELIDRLIK